MVLHQICRFWVQDFYSPLVSGFALYKQAELEANQVMFIL